MDCRTGAPDTARTTRLNRPVRAAAVVAGGAAAALALAACGGGSAASSSAPASNAAPAAAPASKAAAAAPGASSATATINEKGCSLSTTKLGTGRVTFTVTNVTPRDGEFYFVGPAGFVEEQVPAGKDITVLGDAAAPGAYEVKCKLIAADKKSVDVYRVPVTVTGEVVDVVAAGTVADKAVIEYKAWVMDQAKGSYENVEAFADAVVAGDRATAKSIYAKSRVGWERIEPVAESLGDLDPRMDARDGDLEEGQAWGGWHRLEKALWSNEDLAPMAPVAKQLEADYEEMLAQLGTVQLTPLQIAQGAKELVDEVSRGKITGEEERYSHTDLVDFEANIAGAHQAFESLEPVALPKAPELEEQLDTAFDTVNKALAEHKRGDGFVPYTELTKPQIRTLQDAVDALGEPLAQLAAAVK